jgi:hypothetical protein
MESWRAKKRAGFILNPGEGNRKLLAILLELDANRHFFGMGGQLQALSARTVCRKNHFLGSCTIF